MSKRKRRFPPHRSKWRVFTDTFSAKPRLLGEYKLEGFARRAMARNPNALLVHPQSALER